MTTFNMHHLAIVKQNLTDACADALIYLRQHGCDAEQANASLAATVLMLHAEVCAAAILSNFVSEAIVKEHIPQEFIETLTEVLENLK